MKQLKTFSKLRGLIVLALALMVSGNASADDATTTARVNGSAYTAVANGTTRFYLYNVGTGRFMINGGNWGEYAMTLYQDYGSTLMMTTGYLIDTQMLASSQSSNAHYLGLNVPGVTSAGTYGDSNAFGPIYEANSTYSNTGSISGARQWNFIRVETADDATTYTYYMYETLNGTTYYMGVGYGINGDDENNNDDLNTWETLSSEYIGTMTTDDVTATGHEKQEYYQWRLVTETELKALLNTDAQAQAESFGGLNADCSYLVNSGEFTRNTKSVMNKYWTATGSGTSLSSGYRYEWRYGIAGISGNYDSYYTTDRYWNKAILTLMTPYDNKEQGQYSFASFEGVGSFSQTITMTDMPAGWYVVSFDAIALGHAASASIGVSTSTYTTTIPVSSTTYNKLTQAGNLAIAQDLLDNNNYTVSFYYGGSGNVTITFNKDKATQSSAMSSIYYYDTDLLAVDNVRIHFIGQKPEVFDEDYTVEIENNIFDRTFDTKTVLLHRTFTLGKWNSLVLPFDMTSAQVQECFGEDVHLAKLHDLRGNLGADVNGVINFETVTLGSEGNAIEAGKYYIIKLTTKPVHYTFDNIDGDFYKIGRRAYNGANVPVISSQLSTDERMIAEGSYVKASGIVPAGSYVFSGGNIYHLASTKDIKGFRYWFNGTEGSSDVKFAIIGAMHDGPAEVTSIDGITTEPTTVQGVYTINGMKISDDYVGNLPKGLYIINGKKLFVK